MAGDFVSYSPHPREKFCDGNLLGSEKKFVDTTVYLTFYFRDTSVFL